MIQLFFRYTLLWALALGLLAPKMSAVLAEVVPGIQTVVICTGTELITLTIDAEGNPVEAPEMASEDCHLVEPTVGEAAAHVLVWQMPWDFVHVFARKPHPAPEAEKLARKRPTHGPPFSV